MYAKTLDIYAFKAFGKARLRLQYPSRPGSDLPKLRNVNLILGDNGGGKSSVLRALAIAVLAPALLEGGFVPYRLVRRGRPEEQVYDTALLKVGGHGTVEEIGAGARTSRSRVLELLARIDTRGRGNQDRLHLDSTPESPIADVIYDDTSPTFFVAGYGATRRVETGEYSPSSALRKRGLRYQRVAGLFEDHLALRPMQAWLPRLEYREPDRWREVINLINAVLPDSIRFSGEFDNENEEFIFDFEGLPTPFNALSDGYKSFVGWIADLLGHLTDVTSSRHPLAEANGIVLVDEIDLHLHPSWQRSVIPMIAHAFPRLQFVFTSHSPLVASTVQRQNVFVTGVDDQGIANIKQLDEKVFGRSAEQLLLSSYFGLETTRPDAFEDEARLLFRQAARGDADAALAYLKRLTSSAGTEEQ